jgi:sterol 3beta-glucosyltransferase
VDAVVHHGGSGTTAAGLRAGKPTLVCPVLGDQPFWGRRVHELGVGPRPLPLRRATSQALAARITDLLSNAGYATAARILSVQLASEDGPGEAIRAMEQIEVQAGLRHGR